MAVMRLFSLTIVVLFLIMLSPTITNAKDSSPFDFINQLKGCHKGNHTKGIHQLKAYLQQFGYLNQTCPTNDDDFDETLESAVITYQENYHLKPTGTLDATTISRMTSPRCGVPDIVNGTNYMKKYKHPRSKTLHAVSHYSFFPGNPRWPSSKTHLTYSFSRNFPATAVAPVTSAFQKWDSATHFTFARAPANQNGDLVIGFHRRDHGDGAPFDGRGGTLAHAFAPTNGRFHYDADERWATGAVADAFDLETVALHEIGHLLGLGHSSVGEAIMFSGIGPAQVKNLHADDINGIKALYNR